MLKNKRKGTVIIISSPSGAGKTTIAKQLLSEKSNLSLSISLTTRKPRPNEIDGVDYKFVTRDYFVKKKKQRLFLEHAKVFDNYYGTLKSEVLKKINKGIDVLLDIDWQGARQIKNLLPNTTLSIFILPPSIKELKKRLKKRESNIQFVNRRMSKAKREIMHWKEYDYAIVNDNLKNCLEKIKKIIFLNSFKPEKQLIVKYK